MNVRIKWTAIKKQKELQSQIRWTSRLKKYKFLKNRQYAFTFSDAKNELLEIKKVFEHSFEKTRSKCFAFTNKHTLECGNFWGLSQIRFVVVFERTHRRRCTVNWLQEKKIVLFRVVSRFAYCVNKKLVCASIWYCMISVRMRARVRRLG